MWFKCNCKYGKCNAISTDRKKICIEMKDVSNVNSFVSPSHFPLKNSGQRQSPWLMTQGVKSNVILPDAVQLRGQSFNCLIVNLRMRHKKHLNFFFLQTTKHITSCSLKHFRDRWGTNCPARTAMADPCPHTSLRQKYARVQVKVGGGGCPVCHAVTIYTIKPWVKLICPCRKRGMLN